MKRKEAPQVTQAETSQHILRVMYYDKETDMVVSFSVGKKYGEFNPEDFSKDYILKMKKERSI
jgi:hypothetical protein